MTLPSPPKYGHWLKGAPANGGLHGWLEQARTLINAGGLDSTQLAALQSTLDQYEAGVDATDLTVSALVNDPTETRTAVELVADAAVAPIAPDGGVRAVGKGEIARSVLDHGVVGDGATDDTAAFNNCFAQGGKWLAPARDYRLAGAMVLDISNTGIDFADGAIIRLPSGYSGDVFRIGGTPGVGTRAVRVDGGWEVREDGKSGGAATVPGNWTAVRFMASSAGTTGNRVRGGSIWWPNRAVVYETSGTGWVNGNLVEDWRVWFSRILVELIEGGSISVQFDQNTLRNIVGQSGQHTAYGVKGLTGRNWLFDHVTPWDLGYAPSAVSMEVLSTARSIDIVGGYLTGQNFLNAAPEGEVRISDFHSLPVDHQRKHVPATDMLVDDTRTAVPTKVRRGEVFGWQLKDGVISGTFWSVRVPPRATQMGLRFYVAGVGGTSGGVRLNGSLSESMTPARALTLTNSVNTDLDLAADDVVVYGETSKIVVSSGAVYSGRIVRMGTATTDTYAGPVVLTGVEAVFS